MLGVREGKGRVPREIPLLVIRLCGLVNFSAPPDTTWFVEKDLHLGESILRLCPDSNRPRDMMKVVSRGMTPPTEVTKLLTEWGNGNQAALDRLMPLVYGELHRMASRYMAAQGSAHTLQTTALIHEAYLRLAGDTGREWENRDHFFRIAATVMRHVLVDHARRETASKRGGEKRDLTLDEALIVSDERLASIVALDDALKDLSKLSPRQSEVVELKYFGGLTVEETAKLLKISSETVMRDWRAARAWLHAQLSRSNAATGTAE
jgi:RNA polymerase sigma factor (TIGR02999 family)